MQGRKEEGGDIYSIFNSNFHSSQLILKTPLNHTSTPPRGPIWQIREAEIDVYPCQYPELFSPKQLNGRILYNCSRSYYILLHTIQINNMENAHLMMNTLGSAPVGAGSGSPNQSPHDSTPARKRVSQACTPCAKRKTKVSRFLFQFRQRFGLSSQTTCTNCRNVEEFLIHGSVVYALQGKLQWISGSIYKVPYPTRPKHLYCPALS